MLRGDEVKETESRDGRERHPRKKSRKSNSASLCSYAAKFPLQTLMYNHMLNPLIRWPQDSQLRNNWGVVGIGGVVVMTFMVLSNTKSLSYHDHWCNYLLLFREPSWAELDQGQDGHMGSGMHTNYSHLCVFVLQNSSQSEATFVLISHQCFFPFRPQNGSLSLRRSCPQNELSQEKSSYSEAACAQWRSVHMWQLTSVDRMCSSSYVLVYVMGTVGQLQECHV